MQEQSQTGKTYQVLARKYRPRSFDDLIGQDPMVQTLSNAFRTGRIAQAYMLTGVRGVGKTTTARILARALNYSHDGADQPTIDLTQEGSHCRAIIEGRHMDVIEMDAASHTGVDAMRDLIESAQYRPATARYKVYIIDEVHMLSGSAFNALLKTLEEPPEHVKFIFATTEIRKVPVTVLSRCQRFDLRRIDADKLSSHLQNICRLEKVDAELEALALVARAADGSVRDSLSMLDQAIAHGSVSDESAITAVAVRGMLGLSDRARIVDLFEYLMKGEVAGALEELKSQYDAGAQPLVVLTDLADFVHLVTRLKYVPDTAQDRSLSEIERTKGKDYAEKLSVRVLGRTWQMLLKGLDEVGSAERPLPAAEMVLVRLAHASSLPSPEDLVKGLSEANPQRKPAISVQSNDTGPPPASQPAPVDMADDVPAEINQRPERSLSGHESRAGAQVLARQEPLNSAEPDNTDPKEAFRSVNSFEELIFLVEDKRDLALKTAIKRHVRLVSFSDGRIEMNLVDNPSREFLPLLGKRLEEWTGKRWMLSVSQEQGVPTLAEKEKAENDARMDDARNNPAVDAIMRVFPGSRIVSVRVRSEASDGSEPVTDGSGDDRLDDFFD